MNRRAATLRALVAIAVPLGGCTGAGSPDVPDRLAGACQVQRCVCRPQPWSGIGGGDAGVSWATDGTPGCATGYSLRLSSQLPR